MTTLVLIISMLSNISLIIMKLLAGFLCNSKALIADGFHSLSDLSTDVIAIIGNILAKRPADKDHPYGHGKINYITSVLIGTFIIIMGITLFKESFNYTYTFPKKITLLVVLSTIIIKLIVSRLLIITGRKENNNILISSGRESFTDVFSSVLVLITLILGFFSKEIELFKYMDMVGSLIISIIIIIVGIRILKENLSSLIGQVEISSDKKNEVMIFLNNNYSGIKDILLLKYGHYYQAFVLIKVNNKLKVEQLYDLIKNIKKDLLNSKFKIKYVHIDFEVERSEKNARITRSRNSKKNSKKESIK